mgnify:CR=1 FL=1
MFSQLQYLLREGFQLARAGHQRVDLAGQHVAREVRVDRLDDLIVVVAHARNLSDVLVQPDDVALFRRVGPDYAERLVEDSPDDEAAAVVLQASPSQHPLEADMLLLGQAEGVFAALIVRCAVLSHRSLVLKGSVSPDAAAPQGEHLCMPKTFSAYKGTARCSRYGNKTPLYGSLVPRIENHTQITPATLGFQGAILQRRGESGKPFGRPPAVRSGQPIRGPRWRIILRTKTRKNGCGIVRRRASARASRQDRFAANIFRQIRE